MNARKAKAGPAEGSVVVVEPVRSEPPVAWDAGGLEQLATQFDRANAGVWAIIDFGKLALHYHAETGMPMTLLCEDSGIHYKTAMRYVAAARAAQALLSEGMTELPTTATAILSAAKASDADKAEELRETIDADPNDPAAQETWRKVLAGDTPVGRWKAAYMGINKTLGTNRKNTDVSLLAARALSSLRTVWDNWDTLPGADKGNIAEALAATLLGCSERGYAPAPAAVIEELVRTIARNKQHKGR